MSSYGKINLIGMLALPLVAVLAAIIMFGVRIDTLIFVFGMNAVPMLIGGLISALLLRSANKAGGSGQFIALWPTLVPAVIGSVWYLSGALVPSESDPGREYIAAPIYLVLWVIGMGLVAWIGGIIARSSRS